MNEEINKSSANQFQEFLDRVQPKEMPSKEDFLKFKEKLIPLINLDLRGYKDKQMERRINSLMVKNDIKDLDKYFNVLKTDPKKLEEFLNMLTINVTEFFRNKDKFEQLKDEFLPLLLKNNDKLKIW